MTTYFVTKSGLDTNSGLSLALAKKTIQAAATLMTGADTVQVYRGTYKETVTFPNALVATAKAFGHVVIDGENTRGFGFIFQAINQPNMDRIIDGFVMRNHLTSCIRIGSNNNQPTTTTNHTVRNCVLHDSFRGVDTGDGVDGGAAYQVFDSVIYSCSDTGVYAGGGSTGFSAVRTKNVTIYGCGKGVRLRGTSGTAANVFNTLFLSNTTGVHIDNNLGSTASNNSFFGNTNVGHRGGTDYTTLVAWQTATSADAGSLDSDPLVIDVTANLFGLQAASPLFGAGINSSDIGGRTFAGFALSNTFSPVDWAGGTFVDTQLSGSGRIELIPPATTGTYASVVKDLGAGQVYRVGYVDLSALEAEPTDVIDTDNTDTAPNAKKIEIRASMTTFLQTDLTPAWVSMEIGSNVSFLPTGRGRYFQVRLTLRQDGVEA